MATTIATLTEKTDGTLEGVFATIRVNAPIALIPNVSKASEEAPGACRKFFWLTSC